MELEFYFEPIDKSNYPFIKGQNSIAEKITIFNSDVYSKIESFNDPYSVTIERAIELIEEKKIKDLEKTIKTFDEDKNIKVVLDRWKNPSVYYKKKYFKIPKGKNPADLTLQDCLEIAGADSSKKKTTKASKK